jgi:hypothetical protein
VDKIEGSEGGGGDDNKKAGGLKYRVKEKKTKMQITTRIHVTRKIRLLPLEHLEDDPYI